MKKYNKTSKILIASTIATLSIGLTATSAKAAVNTNIPLPSVKVLQGKLTEVVVVEFFNLFSGTL